MNSIASIVAVHDKREGLLMMAAQIVRRTEPIGGERPLDRRQRCRAERTGER